MQESSWTNFGENASTALDSLASKVFNQKYNLSASYATQSIFDFDSYTQSLATLTHEFHTDILGAEPSLNFLQRVTDQHLTPRPPTPQTLAQNLSNKINEKLSTFTASLTHAQQNSLTTQTNLQNFALRKEQISMEPLLAYINEKISYCIHDINYFFVGGRKLPEDGRLCVLLRQILGFVEWLEGTSEENVGERVELNFKEFLVFLVGSEEASWEGFWRAGYRADRFVG
jgi:hypothetical protein